MRLINAEMYCTELYNEMNYPGRSEEFMTAIDVAIADLADAPTVDAVPARHGKWEPGNPICPVCGGNKFKDLDADIWCDWQPDFCPNCGAKMDGGAE